MSNRKDWKAPPTDERLMGGQNMSMAGAAPQESEEEHRFTPDSPRGGPPGTSREERGYPREGEEPERRAGDEPPERRASPRK
ncbi:MAG TPA: hypothetical protein VLQ93_24905 [Myxococcaceae bacterium]|nr:hypothetical protein [Myxococcaceae bacterium]